MVAPVLSLLSILVACDRPAESPKPAPQPAPAQPAPATAEPGVPAGLAGPPPQPADNPTSAAKVELGRALFLDPRLSVDGSRSCYSCHVNERGNADGRALALGAGDKPLARNTPTIWNVGYLGSWYWDGRAGSLEAQAIGAWKGGNMGVGAGLEAKAAEIGALPEYAAAFRGVFALSEGQAVQPSHVAAAIAAYERTLLCGDPSAPVSEAVARGRELFQSKGRCVACHTPPLYTDGLYHDIGLSHDADGRLLPGADPGRGKVTGEAADQHRFRTPTLRNVARTGPYFHDGRQPSLEAAVRYMAQGGNPGAPGIDPILEPTGLDDSEIGDVVAFLEWLVCDGQIEVSGDPRPVAVDAP